jgi:hypothetical protein
MKQTLLITVGLIWAAVTLPLSPASAIDHVTYGHKEGEFCAFRAEAPDPFDDPLRRSVELACRRGLRQTALDYTAYHRLSTFRRQRRILVGVHSVLPSELKLQQPHT